MARRFETTKGYGIARPPSTGYKGEMVNIAELVLPKVQALLANPHQLGLAVRKGKAGETIIDASNANLLAGVAIAEICMGGLGEVRLCFRTANGANPAITQNPTQASTKNPATGEQMAIEVFSHNPVIACLASQYAGWKLQSGDFFALASGPARAQAQAEELFAELKYKATASKAVLVLETDKPPPPAITEKVANKCGVKQSDVIFITTPTTSLAGAVQIVARVLEVALHKANELGFELANIKDGGGTAPLCPPSPNFITAMGRTNDAVIYGGTVQLFVGGDEAKAKQLATNLPSSASKDYGEPFAKIFKRFGGDFYAIDGNLFSPAQVLVHSLASGNSFGAGAINQAILNASFFGTGN